MKKVIFSIFILALVLFQACEMISEADRYIEVPPVVAQKRVLLEEYTGMRCTNCPDAARMAGALKDSLGENLIIVNIHTGNNARPLGSTFREDFRTEGGTAYSSAFGGLDDHPVAMIDRTLFDGSVKLHRDKWSASVISQIQNNSPIEIVINNEWNEASKNTNIKIKLTATESYSEQMALQVWLVEDSIIAPQLDKGEIIDEYVHRHMLRATVNGTWGEDFTTITQGETLIKEYDFTIPEKFTDGQIYTTNPKNCSIVAFVYRTSDRSVVQANEEKIIN